MPRAKNPNPKSKIISNKAALSALATLIQYGRQSYKKEYHPGMGQCLGMALSKLELSPTQALAAAAEVLEDQNYHTLASAVRKLRDGDFRTDMHGTIIIRSDA